MTIIVPCFNEERRLAGDGFQPLLDAGASVLFVDDGSTDQTLRVLRELCVKPGMSMLALGKNQGKAEAVRRGLLAALESGADIVGYLDADLATPASEMVRLTRHIGEHQAALGSRVALLGRHIERKASRHYLGRVFATLASIILDLRVYDTQCGAKAFAASPLLASVLAEPFSARWAFDVELIGRLIAGAPGLPGLRPEAFVEMPLRSWVDVAGSKLRPLHFPLLGLELLRIRLSLGRRQKAAAASLPRHAPAARNHLA
ncbi:MAG TPA: glycosyltransferase [Myxococcales bacterium]|nr:glycosyltransferase [Myxococcales bacterium]